MPHHTLKECKEGVSPCSAPYSTNRGYVVISVVGETWTIEDCGDRDASGARVGALLQALDRT